LQLAEYLVHLNGNIKSLSLGIKDLVTAAHYLVYQQMIKPPVDSATIDFVHSKIVAASTLDALVATIPKIDGEFAMHAAEFLRGVSS
jgi:hypothetical protein